jgi:HK97 family phage prohead protease
MEPDFGGYATKAGLRCSDGRVIKPEAFQHMNGVQVPLVWQHGHSEASNVLGHAVLEARPDGVYARGFFNGTPNGLHAKEMVLHKDITSLSIYANQLKEQNKIVNHGSIREVSLVLSGANPGAKIDHVRIQHSADPDDITELDDEAYIYSGLTLEHAEDEEDTTDAVVEEEVVEHADATDMTVQDVYDSMNEEQQNVTQYLIGAALEEAASASGSTQHSDTDAEGAIAHEEGTTDMGRNVFDQSASAQQDESHALTHDDIKNIFKDAQKRGSLKEAVEAHALEHGITNIDVLFPDAKNTNTTPEFDASAGRSGWPASSTAPATPRSLGSRPSRRT